MHTGSVVVSQEVMLKHDTEGTFDILKSDELVIGGYASIEIVDKQNALITLAALNDAVKKYLVVKKYRKQDKSLKNFLHLFRRF